MFLVPSEVNMRAAGPILPLKIQNSNASNRFWVAFGCFRALLSRTTSGVLSCAPQTRRHAGCGSYYRHTPQTPSPRPIWPQICVRASAVATTARACWRSLPGRPCVVVGGLPLTNTHNALPRWCLCNRHRPWCVCEGAGRPWTWLCGPRAAAEARLAG